MNLPPDFGPSALTIGNFDGVHAGHQVLMRETVALARAHCCKASVLTFDPHPAYVVAPAKAPRVMTRMPARTALMRATGIDQVLVLPFTEEVARLTPKQFIENLVGKLGVRAVVVGQDFRFGARQAGNTELLAEMGRLHGFEVRLIPPVLVRGHRVSSSLVRQAVHEGRMGWAARLLTRPYFLEGPVVSGHGIGRAQTVPTLNLAPDCEVIPKPGVYVTRTKADGHVWNSLTNVGYRPTFDGDSLTIETFLLGPLDRELSRIQVDFLHRVRDERKFPDAAALKAQILRDVARANAWFRRTAPLGC